MAKQIKISMTITLLLQKSRVNKTMAARNGFCMKNFLIKLELSNNYTMDALKSGVLTLRLLPRYLRRPWR